MNDLYSLSESEVHSSFDDDGGGMEDSSGMGDITLSSIHGNYKYGIAMVILRELLSLFTYSNRWLTVTGRYSDVVVWTGQ